MPIRAPKPAEGGSFTPCPPGQHSAVCVDVIDLGEMDSGFRNDDGSPKVVHKIRIVWQVGKTMADGRPFIVDSRYNLTLNEYNGKKSNLLQLLEAWGLNIMDLYDETNEPDFELLIGRTCVLNVAHKAGTKDPKKMFANVVSLMPLLDGMAALKPKNYTRKVAAQPKPDPDAFPEDGVVYDGTLPYDGDPVAEA